MDAWRQKKSLLKGKILFNCVLCIVCRHSALSVIPLAVCIHNSQQYIINSTYAILRRNYRKQHYFRTTTSSLIKKIRSSVSHVSGPVSVLSQYCSYGNGNSFQKTYTDGLQSNRAVHICACFSVSRCIVFPIK